MSLSNRYNSPNYNTTSKNIQKETAAQVLRTSGSSLITARTLGQLVFIGNKEANGLPYSGRTERIADSLEKEGLKAIVWLHDILNKAPTWSLNDLKDIGFSPFIIGGVAALMQNEQTSYFDAIVHIGHTPQAVPVMKSLLCDNMNVLDLPHCPTEQDFQHIRRSWLAWHYLDDIESEKTVPGTLFSSWMEQQSPQTQNENILDTSSDAMKNKM